MGAWSGRAWRAGLALAALAPLAASRSPAFSVRVIDDPGPAQACADPTRFPNPAGDLNRMPQAEVALDVAEDGRLAAAAKDFRYSPPGSTRYNDRVWNGLYLSSDGGSSWRNLLFEDSDPNRGLPTTTRNDLGQAPGLAVTLSLETDPVVAFDGDGNLYTSALALGSGAGSPSAVVLSRRDPQGRPVPGATHFFGSEADDRLANDKNWLAVDREARADEAVVVQTWRLFVYGPSPPAEPGGWIAASADGARSFSPSLRLPVPAEVAADSQFYQPVVGRDPAGRKTLYVCFTVGSETGSRLELHLLRADLEGAGGDTAALATRLSRSDAWTYLPRRLAGLRLHARDGYGGDFRAASYFHPSLDPETGHLWVAFHAERAAGEAPLAFVARSTDAGASWSTPLAVDPGPGAQLLPAVAARRGLASLVWYDTRHDPAFAPGGAIRGIDVYYAEVEATLETRRLLRLTPETQAVAPLFTRVRVAGAASRGGRPHDYDPEQLRAGATSSADCADERYGFLGDYIGLAADQVAAYAAWADLRDRALATDVCSGHDCRGNRNANIWFAQIPR